MFMRLLVPLDGSSRAEQVLPYVRWLAKGFQTRVELLRVTEPVDRVSESLAIEPSGRTETGLQEKAQSYLDGVAEDLSRGGLEVSAQVVESSPVFQITTAGEQTKGTLIVMPTRGGYSAERWPIDSVTAKVLHGTTAPVLVIPTGSSAISTGDAKPSTLIVSLDGSQEAERVLPYAASLANTMTMSLTLVTALGAEEVDVCLDEGTEAYLARVAEKLSGEGVGAVERRVLYGDPADGILGAANRTPDSLVVMATRGRPEVARLIVGSTTDQVVRRASGPVLVIHATG